MNKIVIALQIVTIFGVATLLHAPLRGERAKVEQPGVVAEIVSPEPASQARRSLMDAIRQVESGGFDGALGAAGECGPYQVTLAWWTDASIGLGWDAEATFRRYAFDRATCEFLMDRYWARYGAVTDEQKARMHNGGPTMRGTDKYWAKVQKEMK